MSQLKFLTAYPITLQNQVRQLIADNQLGDYLTRRYPQRHDIQTDKMLYQYTMLLKHNTSDRISILFLRNYKGHDKQGWI